jgi:hypothetical protein
MHLNKGLLYSNVITPNTEQCLEFFYYRNQEDLGEFNVYVQLEDARSLVSFPVWSQPSITNGYFDWKTAQVPLSQFLVDKPFQVIFEEYVASGSPGKKFAVWLDDVFVRDQSCLPAGDCDFENGFCKSRTIL